MSDSLSEELGLKRDRDTTRLRNVVRSDNADCTSSFAMNSLLGSQRSQDVIYPHLRLILESWKV